MLELAQAVLDITGSKSKIVRQPLPVDDPRQRRPDIEKAHQLLGWTPKVSLKEGLSRTVEYFDQLLGAPKIAIASSRAPQPVPVEIDARASARA